MNTDDRRTRERALAAARGPDRKAQWALVLSVDSFIHQCANGWARTAARRGHVVDLDDLVSEGRLGALEAAERFDPDHGCLFITYVRSYVDCWMRLYITEKLSIVRVCATSQQNSRAARFADDPELAAIVAGAGVGWSKVSLDAPTQDGTALVDTLVATDNVEDIAIARQRFARLNVAARKLPTRHRAVLKARLGGETTLSELGEEYGVSRERVRQIEAQAVGTLRAALR